MKQLACPLLLGRCVLFAGDSGCFAKIWQLHALFLPSAIKTDVMRSCESSTDAGRATLQYLVNY